MDMKKELERWLSAGGIEGPVLCYGFADMDLHCKYCRSYLALTKDTLVFLYLGAEKERKTFSGAPMNYLEEAPELRRFPIDTLKNPQVLDMVIGGQFCVEIDGVDTDICSFTGAYMANMRHVCNILSKRIEGKELTEEDLKEPEGRGYCPKCGGPYPDQNRRICPRCMNKGSVFKRMFAYFLPYKWHLAGVMFCLLLTAVFALFWPYLSGTVLYDQVLGGRLQNAYTALVLTVFAMAGTKAMQQLFGIIQGILVAEIMPRAVNKMISNVFHAMSKLSIRFFSDRQTGALMTRVLDDANEVVGFYIDGMPYLFSNSLIFIGTTAIMFLMNWKMALLAIALTPPVFVIFAKMEPRLHHYYGRRHRTMRTLNSQINDNLTGARVVKAFGRENSELDRFGKASSRVRDAEMALVKYDNQYYAVYSIAQNLAVVLVWLLGSILVLGSNEISYGILITFAGYVSSLQGPMEFFSNAFRWWARAINAGQRILEIIDTNPDIMENEHPITLEQVKGDVELNNVTFSYQQGKTVLHEICFKAPAGKMLGIVGRSGAGKSTLVNLISRLYDPQSGSITLDGVNVKDLSFSCLRRNVAMVSQETYIFMGTVAQNIAYAKADATYEEIVQAAIFASAHDFITKMPDGYDTMIGAGGRSLSGGERQRISIARAVLQNPKILILDEATASVDTETEQRITKAIDQLVVGRTTLSIAHRLSTLKNADWLIVIDNGRIVEEGTHAQLIDQRGEYYKLYELQTKALSLRGIEG